MSTPSLWSALKQPFLMFSRVCNPLKINYNHKVVLCSPENRHISGLLDSCHWDFRCKSESGTTNHDDDGGGIHNTMTISIRRKQTIFSPKSFSKPLTILRVLARRIPAVYKDVRGVWRPWRSGKHHDHFPQLFWPHVTLSWRYVGDSQSHSQVVTASPRHRSSYPKVGVYVTLL